jgi:hypothetical protein
MSSERSSERGTPAPRISTGYFVALAGAAIAVLVLIAGFNFVMDPYAVWRTQWPGINQYRRWLHTDDAPIATVAFHRPRGLVLGNSQVAMGFDPRGPAVAAWGAPLVLAHENPSYDFETQVLEAASRGGGFRLALVEIDQRQLQACDWRQPPVDPSAAVARLLSLSVLPQSLQALAMSLRADRRGPPAVEHQLASGLVVAPVRSPGVALLQRMDYPGQVLGAVDEACADQADRRLAALARLAATRHFALVFFVTPWRLDMLQQAYAEGDWPRLEELKRRLAAVAGRTGAPIWDFSTASLRPRSGVADADYYDSFHFKPPLGERILLAMRPGAADETALAARLTPANIDAVIAADRAAITKLGPGAFAKPARSQIDDSAAGDDRR